MTEFTGQDGVQAVVDYTVRKGSTLPGHIYNKLTEAIAQPDGLQTMNTAMEGLYAVTDEIDQEGRELLRDIASFFYSRNFLGKRERALSIQGVAQRILDGGAVEEEGDPEVDQIYVAPEPTPEE